MRIPTGNEVLTQQVQRLEEENRAAQEALRLTQARCDELQVQADEYADPGPHRRYRNQRPPPDEEFRAQTIQRIDKRWPSSVPGAARTASAMRICCKASVKSSRPPGMCSGKRISPGLRRCPAAWIGWMRSWTSNFLTLKTGCLLVQNTGVFSVSKKSFPAPAA